MKLQSVELLRGAAALSVAMAHADSMIGGNPDLPFGRWHTYSLPGTAGVEFFFVLSGFVMALAHRDDLAHGGHVGRFLWRRFCRIYPLFWVMLALPVHQFWAAPVVTPGAIAAWASLLPIRTDNLLVVAWTLRQEVTFYLMLSLCLLPRVGRFVLAAWVAMTMAWWLVVSQPPLPPWVAVPVSHVFSMFDFEFFAGLLAGWLLPRVPRGDAIGWALLGLGVAGLLWRMSLDGWGMAYGPVDARPVYGACYAAILLGCAVLERGAGLRFGVRGARFAAAVGALSYPLYLSHLASLDAVAAWIGPSGLAARLGPGGTFAVMLIVAVLAAAVVSVLIDRPLQRMLRRVSAGSRSTRPAPG